GAVIRGGPPHFEYVAGEGAEGAGAVSLESGIPVAFGVLTVDSIEQAIERSGTKAGNTGAEAARSAPEMVSVRKQLEAKVADHDPSPKRSGGQSRSARRRKARSLALQPLYSWQVAGQPLSDIEAQLRSDPEYDFDSADGAYFQELLR